eukprot:525318-Prorocentrum_minimum.AAC.2
MYDVRKELRGELNFRVRRWLNKVLSVDSTVTVSRYMIPGGGEERGGGGGLEGAQAAQHGRDGGAAEGVRGVKGAVAAAPRQAQGAHPHGRPAGAAPPCPRPFPWRNACMPDIPELLPAIGQPQFCDPIPMLFYPAIGRPNRFWPFDAGQVLYLPPPVLSWVSPGYTVPDLASRRTRVKASGNLDHHCRC